MNVDYGAKPRIRPRMTCSTCIIRNGYCAGTIHMTRSAINFGVNGVQGRASSFTMADSAAAIIVSIGKTCLHAC